MAETHLYPLSLLAAQVWDCMHFCDTEVLHLSFIVVSNSELVGTFPAQCCGGCRDVARLGALEYAASGHELCPRLGQLSRSSPAFCGAANKQQSHLCRYRRGTGKGGTGICRSGMGVRSFSVHPTLPFPFTAAGGSSLLSFERVEYAASGHELSPRLGQLSRSSPAFCGALTINSGDQRTPKSHVRTSSNPVLFRHVYLFVFVFVHCVVCVVCVFCGAAWHTDKTLRA